jgi:hypothetical protein
MNQETLTGHARFGDHEPCGLTHDVLFMDDLAHVLRTSRSTNRTSATGGNVSDTGAAEH